MIIQATLLYDSLPELPQDSLRTDLRMLAGRHGLPVSGTSELGEGQVRLACLPFEILVQLNPTALSASSFAGALSANLRPSQRGPLARVVADHLAHAVVTVRDTGQRHGTNDFILPTERGGRKETRMATIFAQDVARTVMRHMKATAVLWHPSNQLALPGGLADSEFGRIYLPLCLRLRCTSALLQDTVVINMAQEVVGAEAFLGRPLHVMALSLNRFETLQLAVAFLDRMLEGEARPIAGAIFRDQRGTRVRVSDHAPDDALPDGLIALVEVEAGAERPLAAAVKGSREKVAKRAGERVRSRDLGDTGSERRSSRPVLNEEQMAALRGGLEKSEAARAAAELPTGERLRELRGRAAGNVRKP